MLKAQAARPAQGIFGEKERSTLGGPEVGSLVGTRGELGTKGATETLRGGPGGSPGACSAVISFRKASRLIRNTWQYVMRGQVISHCS